MTLAYLHANDTIAALCSAPGHGAVGILRLSGEDAFSLLAPLLILAEDEALSTSGGWRVRQAALRVSLRPHGLSSKELPVPVLLYLMPAPHSYTREHVVEVHLPGAPALLDAALRTLLEAGARLAEPGEFTFRAFLRGRIDLGQAEAVERLVAARTESERREALARLASQSHQRFVHWRDRLLAIAATLEASIDFDEEEFDDDILQEIERDLVAIAAECRELADNAAQHRPAHHGIPVTFAGFTNAGKSSLINALLGEEAAIVADEHSTTRDRIIHPLHIDGYDFLLEDLPGYDPHGHALGQAASLRALDHLAQAALPCLVVDASRPLPEEFAAYAHHLRGRRVLVALHKQDCPAHVDPLPLEEWLQGTCGVHVRTVVATSAHTGVGLDALRAALLDAARAEEEHLTTGLLSQREGREMALAADALALSCEHLDEGLGLELVAEDLRAAYEAFSRMLGEGYAEDVLENIFTRFCIGK